MAILKVGRDICSFCKPEFFKIVNSLFVINWLKVIKIEDSKEIGIMNSNIQGKISKKRFKKSFNFTPFSVTNLMNPIARLNQISPTNIDSEIMRFVVIFLEM